MTFEPYTFLILSIVFLAVLTRSSFGFGDALVAMPLLSLIGEVNMAPLLIPLTSATTAGVIILSDWHNIHWKSVLGLVASASVGIPLGLIYLTQVDEVIVKAVLAVLVIGFSTFGLIGQSPFVLQSDRSIYLFGFCAGVLGGAYNTHGPPLVVYGTLRGWTAERFRATLQGYFFPTSLAIIAGHSITGRCTQLVMSYYLLCLPVIFLAIVFGNRLNLLAKHHNFNRYVYLLLLIVGTTLLINSLLLKL